jgi:hypothetical protein
VLGWDDPYGEKALLIRIYDTVEEYALNFIKVSHIPACLATPSQQMPTISCWRLSTESGQGALYLRPRCFLERALFNFKGESRA